jgi:hypothetical protein
MKLPVIKHLTQFIEDNDQKFSRNHWGLRSFNWSSILKDEELDVIGELISNMYGIFEVHKMVRKKEKNKKNSFKWFYQKRFRFYR